ncbi:hypothetical protein HID58_043527 [Brassica napus]|uniref:Glutaredoxin domain-containing protein n=1 Tax=Brassica napus TaxID=3708 RepID=A0ABQ8BGS5_BRANA|nr:hypothetical protein HID58_043527 [Brassica napus]
MLDVRLRLVYADRRWRWRGCRTEELGVPEEELSCGREEWPRSCGKLHEDISDCSLRCGGGRAINCSTLLSHFDPMVRDLHMMVYMRQRDSSGVSPAIVEIDQEMYGKDIEWSLARLGCSPPVPAVFVGGKFVGTANTVMTLHLDGSLKRLLKEAGALWL